VLGPLLMKGSGASIDIATNLLTGKFPPIPQLFVPIVDVRDVADAHFLALAKGKHLERYALNCETRNLTDLGEIIYNEFKPKGYKPRRSKMGKCLCWMASLVNRDAKMYYAQWKVRCHVKNDKSIKELGVKYISVEDSTIEMCYSLIKLGLVEDKTK
jgi:nucleoside-diphosphate-sugar epimerase